MMDHVEIEEGTLLYQLLEDPNDANVAYMYELYTDGDALQAHSTSDVMKQIMNAFGGILAGPSRADHAHAGARQGSLTTNWSCMAATYLDGSSTTIERSAAADTRPIETLLDEARAMPPTRGLPGCARRT